MSKKTSVDIPIINRDLDPQYDFSMNMTNISVGTVLYVDTNRHLAKVLTTDGKKMEVGYSSKVSVYGFGENSVPEAGSNLKCIISSESGEPFIRSFLPPASMYGSDEQVDKSTYSDATEKDISQSITASENNYTAYSIKETSRKKNYRNNQYYDKIGGDVLFNTSSGNMIGILRGGVNMMKTSELCQMLQFYEDDLTRIVSRNFELFTDLGSYAVYNENGKPRLEFKGSTGRNPKYNRRDENYEFEFQLGSCKVGNDTDSFFLTFEYKTEGAETLLFTIGRDGTALLKLPKDLWLDTKEDILVTVGKNIGVFSGQDVKVDASNIKLVSDVQGVVDPITNKFTETGEGFSLELKKGNNLLDKGMATLGKSNTQQVQVYDTEVLIGAPLAGHKQLVQKSHVDDKYNELCQVLMEIFSAPALGDLGIPLPFAARSQQINNVVKLLTSLKDYTNFTSNLKGN